MAYFEFKALVVAETATELAKDLNDFAGETAVYPASELGMSHPDYADETLFVVLHNDETMDED